MVVPTTRVPVGVPDDFNLATLQDVVVRKDRDIMAPVVGREAAPDGTPFTDETSTVKVMPGVSTCVKVPAVMTEVAPGKLFSPDTLAVGSSKVRL